jgi:hypothetical protein
MGGELCCCSLAGSACVPVEKLHQCPGPRWLPWRHYSMSEQWMGKTNLRKSCLVIKMVKWMEIQGKKEWVMLAVGRSEKPLDSSNCC